MDYSPKEKEIIALAAVKGLSAARFCNIIAACAEDTVAGTLFAKPELLSGLGRETVQRVKNAVQDGAEQLFECARRLNVTLLYYGGPGYPQTLLAVNDAPPLLYVRGNAALVAGGGLAVVGARKCTPYGAETARIMARTAADAGVCVVSGLARGIDAAAHTGALQAHGATVAVMGTGIDRCYPAENNPLYNSILDNNGAVVTEQPPGEPPYGPHFPMRNRIITALADALLVVEAGEKSGALITCRHAQAQGLPIAAVPGNIDSPASAGSNRLLREGAAIITGRQDLLEFIGADASAVKEGVVSVSGSEYAVISLLQNGDLNTDELAQLSGFLPQKLACLLTTLELRGIVLNTAGGIMSLRRGVKYVNNSVSEEIDGPADC